MANLTLGAKANLLNLDKAGDRRPSADYAHGFPRQFTPDLPLSVRGPGTTRGGSAGSLRAGQGAPLPPVGGGNPLDPLDLHVNENAPDRSSANRAPGIRAGSFGLENQDSRQNSARGALPTAPENANYETSIDSTSGVKEIDMQGSGRISRGSHPQSNQHSPRPISSRGSQKGNGKSPTPPPGSGGGQRPPSARKLSQQP